MDIEQMNIQVYLNMWRRKEVGCYSLDIGEMREECLGSEVQVVIRLEGSKSRGGQRREEGTE
jgi:hypothetical protein